MFKRSERDALGWVQAFDEMTLGESMWFDEPRVDQRCCPRCNSRMFIKQIVVSNVRSIASLRWKLEDDEEAAGWHVVIGDNGAGKSAFLRAVALALAGPREAPALRQDWGNWLRSGSKVGLIAVMLDSDPNWDKFAKGGKLPKNFYLTAHLVLRKGETGVELFQGKHKLDPTRHVWGNGVGWFNAGYGPFRRFTGGDKDQEKLFYTNPRLARHLSVFGESIALSEAIEWLRQLHFRRLERDHESAALLTRLRTFVNQPGFLPQNAQLKEISSRGVQFVDGNGFDLSVEDLSDGFRSILSMTFELIRQLAQTFGADRIFEPGLGHRIIAPGVVLIDEIDVHLHPTWQLRVGRWFRDHFPNIQFIVSTHSPLICQSADIGSVYLLPRPGTNEGARMVTGIELDRLLYGNVLDAYGTGLFGEGVTRSPAAKEMLKRLAVLNRKGLSTELEPEERAERDRLRATFATNSAEGEGP